MNKVYYDYIIVGAGPAGLQLAYYYKQQNINYLVIEKEACCGSFFKKYPLSSKLISINKRFTSNKNGDFNLRHDWNSLLNNDDFLFKNHSSDFLPDANDLHSYLNDFHSKYELNIQFGVTTECIHKHSNKDYNYELCVKNDVENVYICKQLICATGLSKKNIPEMKMCVTKPVKHYGDYSKSDFEGENLKKYENKVVLLFGGGNASYELANILNNYCSTIIILGSNKELSIVSHYTGDLRSNYLSFLDTFYLKSLNGIDTFDKENIKNITIYQINEPTSEKHGLYQFLLNGKNYYSNKQLEYFDEIIFCTGWKFDNSIFNFNIDKDYNEKFPKINYNYESSNNSNLFFIGSLMHSHDFKKSSGGFIHGFRYLIKLFTQMTSIVPYSKHVFKFDGTMKCYTELAQYIYTRINTTSSLYQMYGVLCDAFYFDKVTKEIVYYNSINLKVAEKITDSLDINILVFRYGEKEYDVRKLGGFNKFNPVFLHPEICIYKRETPNSILIFEDKFIFEEDIVTDFRDVSYLNKISRTLKGCPLIL